MINLNQFITTCVSIALGAILSLLAQWFLFSRQQKAELKRSRISKLEELYVAISEYQQRAALEHARLLKDLVESEPIGKDVDENKLIGTLIDEVRGKISGEIRTPFHRVEMLYEIYALSLIHDLHNIKASLYEIGLIEIRHIVGNDLYEEALGGSQEPSEKSGKSNTSKVIKHILELIDRFAQAKSNIARLAKHQL